MKLLGSISELVAAIFRQNTKQITLRPNAGTTYSADRVGSLPNQDADFELVSKDANQALTNKTIDASFNILSNIANSNVSATAAIDWSKINKSGSNLTDLTTRSHTSLTDIGTTTHANIDIALAASSSHIGASTNVHGLGVGSAVVGTTDNQVLTTKSISGDTNTISNLAVSTLKTVIGQAFKFLSFDVSGAPIATKSVPTGDVVGTSDAQVLTNKDIDGGSASNSLRVTIPKGTTAAITALTRKEGTLLYSTDDKVMYYDNGTILSPVGSAGLKTPVTLTASTTLGVALSVAVASYQNVVVKYSLVRGAGERRMGQIFLMYDGTGAHVVDSYAEAADCGVEFDADVSGGSLRLLYTTTGASCSMVYFLDQWSN